MTRVIFYFLFFSLFFFSCKSKMQNVLNVDSLKSSFISIEANKAYDLKTSKGAIIKIAANSFDVPVGVKIYIEIKEAYSVQDI